ncbi:iron-sulfur cluster biosynthesis transcriptional regulator SufR [Calothrix sp. PCC 6303]|uniref:iron-sulfur cluster biosynthesis transcriptional regulator SufR n=1 Tax=Calothrix sp. PCC 6303 TaxID=1170562 RepID=UPI0002A03962|nr:iron-sulfur cluster biosynthesis transcriptional regulator SufR [Calothrix sp. PCC 6303]AFZ03837.1 transcriptional regulator [Calothrix sp. PCC 6303]
MQITQQSSTKQDILEYLLKHSQASALELAEAIKVSPQAIRRHLKDLETEDLIVYFAASLGKKNQNHDEEGSEVRGMGRPQHIYRLSQRGRDRIRRASEEQGDSYGNFAVSLLDTIAETVGRDQFSTILQKQWERKALEYRERVGDGSLLQRLAILVELRKAEGYMTECHAVETQETSTHPGFIIAEHNCAISNVAESFPSVCGHELEMFAAILPDCIVERTHWMINGEPRCGYLVRSR